MLRIREHVDRAPELHDLAAYMMAIRSHVSAMTLRSWEIRIMDRWRSRRSRSRRSRICAWIITSRAVTARRDHEFRVAREGHGDHHPLPHAAGELMGKSRTRARGMPTSSRSSSAPASPPALAPSRGGRSVRRFVGRSADRVQGVHRALEMIEMSFHRTFRIAVSEARVRSRPLKRIRPRTIFPLYGKRRMSANAVVVLPHPLSPARPSASPSSRPNETPSTAWTVPLASCTRRRGPRPRGAESYRLRRRGFRISSSAYPKR